MDTTFKDSKSKHNVHWVACADCHPKGVPPRKPPADTLTTAAAPGLAGF
jgi:hypothetical protein